MGYVLSMSNERYGDWMQTFGGRRFYPLDPKEDELYIEDIAHALSLQNRYGGHSLFPYSVAQHSVYLSHVIEPEFAYEALMHDASEAYLCDIPRPIKPDLHNYYQLEGKLMEIISKKFGFKYPMSAQVKFGDNRMLTTEKRDVMRSGLEWENYTDDKYPPYENKIVRITPEEAESLFLQRFKELTYGK